MVVSILVGTVLGALAGLGVGGGSLLILWLTLVEGMAPETARFVNLLFFLPSAAVACLLRLRQGTLSPHRVGSAILAGCLSAALCAFLATQLDTGVLRKLFGALLILTGLRELFYKPRSSKCGRGEP